MKNYRTRLIVPLSLVIAVLLLAACQPSGEASSITITPTTSDQQVAPTDPIKPTSTPVPPPQIEVDIPPTALAQEADEAIDSEPNPVAAPPPEQHDDLFPLLLNEKDSLPPRALLTQAEAGKLEEADCEERLCAHGVYQVTASLNLVDVRFDQYLFYYPDLTRVEERIANMQSPGALGGTTLHSRPAGSNLSPDTIIIELDNARALLTWYDLWEIFIFTENPDVETRAAIDTLNRLAEIQIDKLIDAGYLIEAASQQD